MSDFKVTGKIEKVMDVESGTSKAGNEWKKTSFVLKTEGEYNNLYVFDVFGEEKVDNFMQYNKVGSDVEVSFNVRTNEYKEKYYVSLDAWKIFKATADVKEEETSDLPFG